MKRHREKINKQKPRDFYKFAKLLPEESRCMVVLALTYPKFTVVFFLWFFIPALSIQFMDIGDVSQVLFTLGVVLPADQCTCFST